MPSYLPRISNPTDLFGVAEQSKPEILQLQDVTPVMPNNTKCILDFEDLTELQLEPEPEYEPLEHSSPVEELSINQGNPDHQPIGSHLWPQRNQKSEESSRPSALSLAQLTSQKDIFGTFRSTLINESEEKDDDQDQSIEGCRTRNSSGYSSNSSTTIDLMDMGSVSPSSKMKTVLCKYYLSEGCSRGDQCSFAHGNDELREMNHGDNSSRSRPVWAQDPKRKTKMCKNLLKNQVCPFSVNCNFAHNMAELKSSPGYARHGERASSISPISSISSNSQNISYKTRMCKHYFRQGICWLQENCNFAHGPEELRREKAKKRAVSFSPKSETRRLNIPQRDSGNLQDNWILVTKKKGLRRKSS